MSEMIIIETPSLKREWFREQFMQQPVHIGMDVGSEEYGTRWRYDPKTGTYKMLGPEETEKRRAWYQLRARLDEKFAAENPGWDRERR